MVQKKKNKLSSEKWLEIRNLYVQGYENASGVRVHPSLEQLAKSNDIHWNTIHRRSKNENWKDERAVFESKIKKEVDVQKRNEIIQQSVQFDLDSLKLARSLQGTIANLLTIDNQNARKKQATNDQDIELLKASEINSLSQALEKAQKVGRLAFGESTENGTIHNSRESVKEELHRAYELVRNVFPRQSSRSNQTH